VFATTVINPAGFNGLLHGNPKQVLIQLVAILVTIGYSFIGSGIILKVIDAVMGLRVSEEDEVTGLDLSQHNETGYALGGFGGGTMEHGIPGSAVLRPETSFTMQAHPANKPQ